MTSVETRNLARDSLFLFAELSLDGTSETTRVKVRNLSAGGMMAEAAFAITSGTIVTVTLRNIGEVRGRVAWAQNQRFGIAFDAAIDPSQVRVALTGSPAEAPRYARAQLPAEMFPDHNLQVRRV